MTVSGNRRAAACLSAITVLAIGTSAAFIAQDANAASKTTVIKAAAVKGGPHVTPGKHVTKPKPSPTPTATATPTPTPTPSSSTSAPSANPSVAGATVPLGLASDGRIVTRVTTAAGTDIWVGKDNSWTHYTGPTGAFSSAFVDGTTVRVITKAASGYQAWSLDLTTGKSTVLSLMLDAFGSAPQPVGPAGYWAAVNTTTSGVSVNMYDWSNNQISSLGNTSGHVVPLAVSRTFSAIRVGGNGGIPYNISLHGLNGAPTVYNDHGVRMINVGRVAVDDKGATYVQSVTPGAPWTLCRLTLSDTTESCTPTPFLPTVASTSSAKPYDVYADQSVTVIPDAAKQGFWVMAAGTVNATFVSDNDYANATLSDAGGKVLITHNHSTFYTFDASGTWVQVSAPVR